MHIHATWHNACVYGFQQPSCNAMKKTFLTIAGLALFATGSVFANTDAPAVLLPAHVVTVSRYTSAERAIEASLAELRQAARATPAITAQPALPARELATSDSAKAAAVAAKSQLTPRVAVKA